MSKVKAGITALLFIVLICGCTPKDQDMVCGVTHPLEELYWLHDLKQYFEQRMTPAGSQIVQYTYNGETVFWVDDCYRCSDGMQQVYNCEGDVICQFGGIAGVNTCPDFFEMATDSILLFSSVEPKP